MPIKTNRMNSDNLMITLLVDKNTTIKELVGHKEFSSKRFRLIGETKDAYIYEIIREVELPNIRTLRYK